jgi:hypothetical protein
MRRLLVAGLIPAFLISGLATIPAVAVDPVPAPRTPTGAATLTTDAAERIKQTYDITGDPDPITNKPTVTTNEVEIAPYIINSIVLDYQKLKYGAAGLTSYDVGSGLQSSYAGGSLPNPVGEKYPVGVRNVTTAEWEIVTSVLGEKPRTIGVRVSYSQKCNFGFAPVATRFDIPTASFLGCDDWEETILFDRVDVRFFDNNQNRTISSAWANRGIPGFGWCPTSSRQRSTGPLAPSSGELFSGTTKFMPAVTEFGVSYTLEQYQDEGVAELTEWGEAVRRGEFSYFLNPDEGCYFNPLPLSGVTPAVGFSAGRYLTSNVLPSTEARVFRIGNGQRSNAELSRAYLPNAGLYIYQTGKILNALMNPNAGRIFNLAGFAPDVEKNVSVATVISCKDRGKVGWQGNTWEPGPLTTMEFAWLNAEWPDQNRESYYDANITCGEGPGPVGSPDEFRNAGGDVNAGIIGRCEYVQDSPTVIIDGVAYPVASGKSVEIRSNNIVRPIIFGDSWVNVQDALGAGKDDARTKTPLQRSEIFWFGGLNRKVPQTVSPSFITTFNDPDSVMQEVNRADGQPYASQTLASLNRGESSRNNWQRLDTWSPLSTNPFLPGLGLSLDEPSTEGNVLSLQTERRTTGTFAMKSTTVGFGGIVIKYVNGGVVVEHILETPDSNPSRTKTYLEIPVTTTSVPLMGVVGVSLGWNLFSSRQSNIGGDWTSCTYYPGGWAAGLWGCSWGTNEVRQIGTTQVVAPTPAGYRREGNLWISLTPTAATGVTVVTFKCPSPKATVRGVKLTRGSLG